MDSTADPKGKRPLYQEDGLAYARAAAAAASATAADEAEAKPKPKPSSSSEEAKPEPEAEEMPPLVLVAEDGVEVRISRPAARMSHMLRLLMEDSCADGPIPAPNVHSDILDLVVQYCEKHGPYYDPEASERARNPFPPFPVELTPTVSSIKPVTYVDPDPHGLKDWDKDFISLDNSTLFEVILVKRILNLLDLSSTPQDLLDLGTTMVADMMRGKKPEEIREIFEIENDYTPEQEAELRKENAWAFED
ncbi:SKP1-like protein 1 [Lolium rigidum]|uniref:SKP1-like protein 1 n=1 Tax=Lolium rigidum TaxID=89674 RepID=UPI001F5DADA8|nr:SKP1-like protein 1 [Lolium rigidum]